MVQVDVTPEAMCLAFVLGAARAVTGDPAVTATERAVPELSSNLRGWLADPSPASAAALRERIALGAPAAAVVDLLDALRKTPRADLVDVVVDLSRDRRRVVRAHAIAAWAELGPAHADRAIAAAAGDLDPTIRSLAPALAARHPSESAEQTVVDLLALDEVLAAALAEAEAPIDDEEAAIEIVPDVVVEDPS